MKKKGTDMVVEDVDVREVLNNFPDEVPEQDNGFDTRLIVTKKDNKFSFGYIKTFKISDVLLLLDECKKDLQKHQQSGTFDKVNGMREVS